MKRRVWKFGQTPHWPEHTWKFTQQLVFRLPKIEFAVLISRYAPKEEPMVCDGKPVQFGAAVQQ